MDTLSIQTLGIVAVLLGAVILGVLLTSLTGRPQQPTDSLPAGTTIKYTLHARQRMRERGVAAVEIECVLAAPERTKPDHLQDSVRLERDFDNRTLNVWVVAPWPIIVKTTAWTYRDAIQIPQKRIGAVIGRGGTNIRSIENLTETRITVDPDGTIHLRGNNLAAIKAATTHIRAAAQMDQQPLVA